MSAASNVAFVPSPTIPAVPLVAVAAEAFEIAPPDHLIVSKDEKPVTTSNAVGDESEEPLPADPCVLAVAKGAVGALTPADENAMSVTFESAVWLVNVTVAALAVPECQADDKVPLHIPLVTVFPLAALAARLANPAATSAAEILPVAVSVSPPTVTDCPRLKA